MINNILGFNHIKGDGLILGATKVTNGIMFTTYINTSKSLYLLIFDKDNNLIDRVDMLLFKVNSCISSCIIKGLETVDFTYIYEKDGHEYLDEFVKNSTNSRKYKDSLEKKEKGKLYVNDFNWEGDEPLHLKYSDIYAYQLHVRGFTAHSSSKVLNRGKYIGVTEKIPHLISLGINQVILMPTYEFLEWDIPKNIDYTNYLSYSVKCDSTVPDDNKLNYWGFKEGYYFMPKVSYGSGDAVNEFKLMVKKLHKAGIEVIMRFYFPSSVNISLIPEILKFWAREYHVDGFFLMGNKIPMELISSDMMLRDVKIYNVFFDKNAICDRNNGYNRNLALVNNEFSVVCRKYLKSDEDMLQSFLYRQRLNSNDVHIVNYITDYEGFTLNDLVSYDYKHNDDNEEDNKDGENYNYSWNCGYEGYTRKKSVMKLRMSQIKNALVFLILAQGTPMLLAGDEFLNTQNGNNNPYCQDNAVGWVVWKNTNQHNEIFEFIRELIKLRKSHPILHPENEFRIMDYAACGYPDLSYHGDSAWAPRFDNHLRHIGVMICGKYAKVNRTSDDDFFYIAYNMHWEEHTFGLPKLPKGYHWKVLLTTGDEENYKNITEKSEESIESINVAGRYITILKSYKIDEQI